MLLGLVLATSGTVELLGRPMPADGREVLPPVGALVEGPAAYGAPVRARQPAPARRERARGGARRAAARRRVDEALEQVGPRRASTGGRSRRTPSGCGSGSGWPRPCCAQPRLLVLDEPTNGLDPQGIREIRELLLRLNAAGTTIFLSSHLLAEVEQMCTRVGVLDRGRLVLQDELATLHGADRPRRWCAPPTSPRAVALLDGRVEARDGDRAASCAAPTPAALNALLVAGGVRVTSSRPSGAPWRTSSSRPTGRERGPGGAAGRRMIRRRAAQAVPPAADLGDDRAARRAADAGRGAAGGHRPRPAARDRARRSCRPCWPTARCSRWPRWRSCCRCSCRSPSPWSAGDAIAGEAQAGTLRYLLIRPVGRTRLLVAKLVAVLGVRAASRVVVVAVVGYVVGRTAARQPAAVAGDVSVSRAPR